MLPLVQTVLCYAPAEGEEDDEVMKEWFALVLQKNQLLRKEADLVYM